MNIEKEQILTDNQGSTTAHDESFDFLANTLDRQGSDVSEIVQNALAMK